jgi:predicted nucleic acid-binding protein
MIRRSSAFSWRAQAVAILLQGVDNRDHELCGSTALRVENEQNPKLDRRTRVDAILRSAGRWVNHNTQLERRAAALRLLGFRPFDAYHVASAESGECDHLVTCDDQLLRVARRNAATIQVSVIDPITLVSGATA